MMNPSDLIRKHLLPVIAGAMPVAVLGGLGFLFLHAINLYWMGFLFLLGGAIAGFLTQYDEDVDHRGTNGVALMILAWYAYIMLAKVIFPDGAGLSDYVFKVMGANIINGFAIAVGVFAGDKAKDALSNKVMPAQPQKRTPVAKTSSAPYPTHLMPMNQRNAFNSFRQANDKK